MMLVIATTAKPAIEQVGFPSGREKKIIIIL